MGILDNRDSPSYKPSLEKLRPLERIFGKIFSIRKDKLKHEAPAKNVRIFGYHLLTQQGIPAGFKVGFLLIGMILPPCFFALANGRHHPYRKDPFR